VTTTAPKLSKPTKPAAPAAKAPSDASTTEASAPAAIEPVKAVHRINGVIEPGTIFTPDSDEQREELFDLEAVVELTDDEAKLFSLNKPVVAGESFDDL
jgi:hypothetical protein